MSQKEKEFTLFPHHTRFYGPGITGHQQKQGVKRRLTPGGLLELRRRTIGIGKEIAKIQGEPVEIHSL